MPTAGPQQSGQELRPLNPQIIIIVRTMPTPPIAIRRCAPAIRAAVRAPIAEAAAATTSKVEAPVAVSGRDSAPSGMPTVIRTKTISTT